MIDDLWARNADAGSDVESSAKPNNENNETADVSAIVKRKIVRKPRPKLNHERLTGDRGIVVLEKSFQEVKPKFKGKGYEKEDLDLTMKVLEHWTHRLFPKLPFDNILDKIERLGSKRSIQNFMKNIREDMPAPDVDGNADGNDGEKSSSDAEDTEVSRPLNNPVPTEPRNYFDNDDFFPHDISEIPGPSNVSTPAPEIPMELTEEQRNTIRANRLRAIERRSKLQKPPTGSNPLYFPTINNMKLFLIT